MFGQAFGAEMRHRRTRRPNNQRTQATAEEKKMAIILQFLPLILILLFFGLFSGTPESYYSTHMTDKHKYPQKTYTLNLPFFVSSKYFNISPREKQQAQNQIEREYLQDLQSKCSHE